MKRWFRVFLLVFFIVIILALIAIFITAVQIKQIVDMSKESESLTSNFNSLMNGDCSKLPEIETKYAETKTKIKYFCMNPIIKIGLEKISRSNLEICNQLNTANEFEGNLTKIKAYCSNKN